MDYLVAFLVGSVIGALVSFLVVRNNPKLLSFNAKKKIEGVVGKATGTIQWGLLKK